MEKNIYHKRKNLEKTIPMNKGKLESLKNGLEQKLKMINENVNIDIDRVESSIALIKIA